jgi:hypothetical protein
MTQDNLTIIRAKINAFDRTAFYTSYGSFAPALSEQLNTLWPPAWNVVVLFSIDAKNYDAVLYGYGFREHWSWFNGMKTNTGFYISFIIWKDFNCLGWITIDATSSKYKDSSFSDLEITVITNTIQAGYTNRDVNDIWLAAQDIQAKVATTGGAIFSDKLAFSVVASQAGTPFIYARICAKDFIVVKGVANNGGTASGATLILQMRSP